MPASSVICEDDARSVGTPIKAIKARIVLDTRRRSIRIGLNRKRWKVADRSDEPC